MGIEPTHTAPHREGRRPKAAPLGLIALSLGILNGLTPDEGWRLAARWTGRASFPLFIVTFVASSLATLYPRTWTRALLRARRWWGLGFAACFAVHLVALSIFNWRTGNFPPAGPIDPGVLAYTLVSLSAACLRIAAWWQRRRRGRLPTEAAPV